MSSTPPGAPAWPNWLVALASVPIVFHLGAVVLGAVVTTSGPWPGRDGPLIAVPPPTAALVHDYSGTRRYLQAVGLMHDYHFGSNRVGNPDATLEVVLEDEAGMPIKTVRVPDPDAPLFVRQRQAQLMRWLVEDQPIPPAGGGERIFPPGKLPPRVPMWDQVGFLRLTLVDVPEPEVPRGQTIFRPTPFSMVVIRSIARHACRVHKAAHARVLRHSRDALSPQGLLEPETIPERMENLISDYGRASK
jgi:hypothetical protein